MIRSSLNSLINSNKNIVDILLYAFDKANFELYKGHQMSTLGSLCRNTTYINW